MMTGVGSYFTASWPALVWRLGLFGCLWLILCGGELASWPFGLPTVVLAAGLSLRLGGPEARRPIRLLVLGGFFFYFFYKSTQAGLDVMFRVLRPRLRIDPGFITFPLTISHGMGRIFLANSISLMPGTISAQLDGDCLIVHTLDRGLPVSATLRDLEARIATLYGPLSVKRMDGGAA